MAWVDIEMHTDHVHDGRPAAQRREWLRYRIEYVVRVMEIPVPMSYRYDRWVSS